jgi:ABC-type multidrug transport system fused ATPase/permease subunit
MSEKKLGTVLVTGFLMSKNVQFKSALKTIVWPRRKLLFVGLILIALSRLAGLVLPWQSKVLLDDVVPSGETSGLYQLLAIVTGAIVVQSVTRFLLTRLLSVEAQYMISQLRAQVQKKVLSLPVRFFDQAKSGELVSRIMSDVEGVRNLVGTGFVQLVGGTITSIFSLVLLIRISPSMTLYVLVPVAIFAIIALKAFKYIRPIFRNRGKINADVTGRLTETLNGIRVIKGFNAEKQEEVVFEDGVHRLFKNVKKSLTSTALITSSATLLLGLASTGIMGIGGHKMIAQELTFGEFLSFTLYLGFMIAPIVQMSNIGSQLTEAMAGLDRTQELLNMDSEHDQQARKLLLPKLTGEIEFEDVSFSYTEDQPVIKDISFKAAPGTVTALVGSSGSGKSTIISLIASFIDPDKGTIRIDGEDLAEIKLSEYRQHLGVVLQDDFLFDGTIKENICFTKPNASDEEIQNAVEAAYVNEFTDRFDKGLETEIGERGVKLSGGQRQRIAIARAILANPKLIILDEATSNLDTESEALIQKSLNELVKNRTTFVIAHRLSTIKKADKILVIEDGRIVEEGNHNELIQKEGRYHHLYTYQSRI